MTSRPSLLAAAAALFAAILPPGDDDVVVRGEGIALTRADYGRWLVDRHGVDFLDDFVTEHLVLRDAAETGALPSDEEVEASWLAEREIIVQHSFGGSLERMEAELEREGTDLAQYTARRKRGITMELALMAMARAARSYDDDLLRRRYKDVFGAYGEAVTLEVAFFSAYAGVDPDGPRPDVNALRQAALARAGRAVEALAAGTPFAEVLATSDAPGGDPVEQGLLRDGRVAQYRKNLLGPEVDRAVQKLDEAGQVAPPVSVWDGAWVVRLVRREPMTFEAAQDEVLRILREDKPTAEEMGNVVTSLRAKYGVAASLR